MNIFYIIHFVLLTSANWLSFLTRLHRLLPSAHFTRSLISLLGMRNILALGQNLKVHQSSSAANNPIMHTFAQHVGHAQERTLRETLQHPDKFSSARTNSTKRVVLIQKIEGHYITGMGPLSPTPPRVTN